MLKLTLVALALALNAPIALAQISMPSIPATEGTGTSMPSEAQAAALLQKANDKVTVHLNSASVDDLQKVPGLGPDLAKAIVAARPFKSVTDLKNVPGMKEAVYAKIKNHVTL